MQIVGAILIGVGVVVGVAALAWWFVTSIRGAQSDAPGVADIDVRDGKLVITPRGAWKVLALTGRLEVELHQVGGCEVDPDPRSSHPVTFRMAGTGLPGRIRAGYMVGQDGRSWWLCRSGESAVIIELEGNRLSYLVVEVDDPSAVAQKIRHAAVTVR